MNWHLPKEIAEASADERLDSVLWDAVLRAFPPFGAGDQPMVCLSESPPDHLKWLIADRGWQPWGIMFSRQQVYDADGGPVWYPRTAQHNQLPTELRPWAVPFDITSSNRSEWVHKREWRIQIPPGCSGVDLSRLRPQALLVGDRGWRPSTRTVRVGAYIDTSTNTVTDDLSNPYVRREERDVPQWPWLWTSTSKWCWNAQTQEFDAL